VEKSDIRECSVAATGDVRLPVRSGNFVYSDFRGRVELRRNFNWPEPLSYRESLWIVVQEGSLARLSVDLNGQPLGTVEGFRHLPAAWEITPRVTAHNELHSPGTSTPRRLSKICRGSKCSSKSGWMSARRIDGLALAFVERAEHNRARPQETPDHAPCPVVQSVWPVSPCPLPRNAEALSPDEIRDGWIQLFDDETLFNWEPGAKTDWWAGDGVVRATGGEPGLLCTTSEFADYVLKVEFRGSPRTNSGISCALHCGRPIRPRTVTN